MESTIGMRGLREEKLSWNTICIWRRSSEIEMPRGPPTGSPSNTSPPLSGVISCISSRAVVDLPQPLSPTMPRTSPLRTENDTSSTACTVATWRLSTPPRTGKYFFRPSTISSGCAKPPRSRGSALT